MKTAKRVLVVLTVVALLVGALAVSAFAADNSTKTVTNEDGSVTTTYNFKSVTSTSYSTYTYDNGWALSRGNGSQATSNAALLTYNDSKAVATLTSPALTGGISNFNFTFWYPYSESVNTIQFTVKILKGDGTELASQQIQQSRGGTGAITTKYNFNSDDYTEIKNALISIGAEDTFKIQIYNNGTSVSAKKSRLAVGPLSWTNLAPVVEGGLTDEEKVDGALEAISVRDEITSNFTQDLVTELSIYSGVSISWASDNALAVVSGDKVAYTLPEAGADDVVVNLTATATCGDITKTKTFQITLVAPMTEAEIVDAAFALSSGATLANGPYTLTGVIKSIPTAYDSGYKNVTVNITVYNTAGVAKTLQCYRLAGVGADAIKVGDEITVTGNIKNYNGTIEFDAGCTLDKYPNPVAINGVALNIANNVDIHYYVSVKTGFKSVSASFTFNGKTVTVTEYEKLDDGRLVFIFEGINPAELGDAVNATVSAKYATNTYTAKNEGMSVKKYYEMAQAYEGTKGDTALMTLLSDLLVYGAKAQTYVGDTDALVTEGLTLTPSQDAAIPASNFAATGDVFKSVALELGSDITVVIKVALEGGDVVTVNFNGTNTTYAQEDLTADENGYYTIKFEGIYATDYAEVITAEVNGNTLTYSVNSYINEKANDENANLAALIKALNNYGASAVAYKNA